MKRFWPYALISVSAIASAAFVFFPLEFIKTGWLESFIFTPISWAVSLIEWHWTHKTMYDCAEISLLGYTSSFSVVVPAVLEGSPENIVSQVDKGRVVFVGTSDYIIDIHQRYIGQSAQLNNALLNDCGIDNFK